MTKITWQADGWGRQLCIDQHDREVGNVEPWRYDRNRWLACVASGKRSPMVCDTEAQAKAYVRQTLPAEPTDVSLGPLAASTDW